LHRIGTEQFRYLLPDMSLLPASSFWEREDILRPVTIGISAYVFLYAAFKVLGAGALAQGTALGLIKKMTIGSSLALAFINPDANLAKVFISFAIYFLLDMVVSFGLAIFPPLAQVVRANPVVVFYEGEWQQGQMLRSRVNKSDVDATLRQQGRGDYDGVHMVVLEVTGQFSVIFKENLGTREAMRTVKDYDALVQRNKKDVFVL
jgi:uncharacterized membrane protein YcaP (DUF421 family)